MCACVRCFVVSALNCVRYSMIFLRTVIKEEIERLDTEGKVSVCVCVCADKGRYPWFMYLYFVHLKWLVNFTDTRTGAYPLVLCTCTWYFVHLWMATVSIVPEILWQGLVYIPVLCTSSDGQSIHRFHGYSDSYPWFMYLHFVWPEYLWIPQILWQGPVLCTFLDSQSIHGYSDRGYPWFYVPVLWWYFLVHVLVLCTPLDSQSIHRFPGHFNKRLFLYFVHAWIAIGLLLTRCP